MTWLLLVACSATTPTTPVGPPSEPQVEQTSAALPEGWLETVVGTDDVGQPLPMVVMVHGLGDRPQSMLRVMSDLPGPARVIAPRAPDAWHDGWSWFPASRSVKPEELSVRMETVAADFVEDLAQATAARPTMGKPVLSGFSQGGMLSFTVATHHPEAVALAVPVAGWLPEPLWPAAPPSGAPPIRALHGLDDDVLPYARTETGVGHMRAAGWDVTLQSFPEVAHRIPPQVRRALYRELQAGLDAQRASATR